MDSHPSPSPDTRSAAALSGLCWLWAGLVLGVSFLATPAKFLAPSVTLPVAVDIGRATFPLLVRSELLLCALTVLLVLKLRLSLRDRGPQALAVAAGLLLLQWLWLLPALDVLAEPVIQGQVRPPSSLHIWYIAADAAKVLALGFVGWAPGRVRI